MRSSFRSALLLGSAFTVLTMSPAFADDPLLPEGADRPKMGKELVLPPVINEAPPNTEIVLPPPGQEHLLGARPANAAEKTEARLADEPASAVKAESGANKPAQKGKRKSRAPVQTAKVETAPVAPVPDHAAVYAGVQKTSVPDQSLVVAEGETAGQAPAITQTNQRLADLPQPAVGGPELSGPPSPRDGMAKAPIRDGDTVNAKVAEALATPPATVETAKSDAPAIERFEIAQATSSPMPVTPGKLTNAAQPEWDVEVSASVGYGRVDSAAQGYFGRIGNGSGSISALGTFNGFGGVTTREVETDDEDDTITYEAAARFNLTGDVEPLGGGSNVEPYVKAAVSGYNAEFSSNHADLNAGWGEAILVPGVNGYGHYEHEYKGKSLVALEEGYDGYGGNYAFNSVDNIRYRGKEKVIKGLIEYGQTWKGSTGVDVTGFAQIAHTRRDFSHTLKFTGRGWNRGCDWDSFDSFCEESVVVQDAVAGYDGVYQTDLDSHTTSFGLGVGIAIPLTKDRRLKADASLRGSYDITTAKGRDSLVVVDNWDGDMIGTSATNRLRRTEESFGYGAGLGVSYEVGKNVGLRLGAEYSSQEAVPVVVRDGVNPSRLELEREDVLIGTLTATIKF